jgi:hypothetical protein
MALVGWGIVFVPLWYNWYGTYSRATEMAAYDKAMRNPKARIEYLDAAVVKTADERSARELAEHRRNAYVLAAINGTPIVVWILWKRLRRSKGLSRL